MSTLKVFFHCWDTWESTGNNCLYELSTIGITLNYLINVYQCLPKNLSVSAIFQKFIVLIIWDMKLTFCCGWTCKFIRRCHKRTLKYELKNLLSFVIYAEIWKKLLKIKTFGGTVTLTLHLKEGWLFPDISKYILHLCSVWIHSPCLLWTIFITDPRNCCWVDVWERSRKEHYCTNWFFEGKKLQFTAPLLSVYCCLCL